jgi:predicted O-methyltransferase YrrM
MSSPSPISAAPHILQLLSELHQISLDQEAGISKKGKVFSSDVLGDLEDKGSNSNPKDDFDRLMLDKFIALDQDKCQFTYQLINAMGATNIVEAGTSFGVSTIYLALAVGKTKAATGKSGVVIATEKETEKAAIAQKYWAQCGPEVEEEIDLREGDLLETLKSDLPEVDLLLLDSKFDSHSVPLYSLCINITFSLVRIIASYTEDCFAPSSTGGSHSYGQHHIGSQGVCRLTCLLASTWKWVPKYDPPIYQWL